MNYKEFLEGKTIQTVQVFRCVHFDDSGFLKINFTDGSSIFIEPTYHGFSGHSRDEYPTDIIFKTTLDEDDFIPDDSEYLVQRQNNK